jgi:hypothetical protein
VVDAAKPLYDSLADAQKRDFGRLIREFKPHRSPSRRHLQECLGADWKSCIDHRDEQKNKPWTLWNSFRRNRCCTAIE